MTISKVLSDGASKYQDTEVLGCSYCEIKLKYNEVGSAKSLNQISHSNTEDHKLLFDARMAAAVITVVVNGRVIAAGK